MYTFTFDYTDGLRITNYTHNIDLLKNKPMVYKGNLYYKHQITKKTLKSYPDQLGICLNVEETITDQDKILYDQFECEINHWISPNNKKYFIPYHIEIFYDDQLYITETLDCKFKLVNFTLLPKDERELYTWLNVIKIFKKQMQCDISIKNDIVASTTEFDDIVDIKYPTNELSTQHYLGLHIGRFYMDNNLTPDIKYHPDGLHNKSSLDIINDILWFNTTYF